VPVGTPDASIVGARDLYRAREPMEMPSISIPDLAEGTARDTPLAALERLAILGRYDADQCVYHCNDSIEHWYRVVRGAARSSALSNDGRRYIVDFVFPGDLFGFCGQRARHFCVEAIVSGTLIARYPRDRAEKLADCDPQIARNVRQAAFESIARMQKRTAILGRASALEKVSGFLLEMSDRGHAAATGTVFLPMPRYDIADYLAMAVETVSRTLTELRTRRTIVFRDARHVSICDRGVLEHFASGLIDVQQQPAPTRERRTHEDLSRSLPQPSVSCSRTAVASVHPE
jgi:CRP/FNR family nitrogen fixation transcriptional regulator